MSSDEKTFVVFSDLLQERYQGFNVSNNLIAFFNPEFKEHLLSSYAIVQNHPLLTSPLKSVQPRYAMLQYLIVVYKRGFHVVHNVNTDGELLLWKLSMDLCQNDDRRYFVDCTKMQKRENICAPVASYTSLTIPRYPPTVMIVVGANDAFARILDQLVPIGPETGADRRKKKRSGKGDSTYRNDEEAVSENEDSDGCDEEGRGEGVKKGKRRKKGAADKDVPCSAVAVDPRQMPFDQLARILGKEYCHGFVFYLLGYGQSAQEPEQVEPVQEAQQVQPKRRGGRAKRVTVGDTFDGIVSGKDDQQNRCEQREVFKPDDPGYLLLTDLMTETQKSTCVKAPSKYVEVKDRSQAPDRRRRPMYVMRKTSERERKPSNREEAKSGMMRVINEPLKPKANYRVLVFNYTYGDIALGEMGLIEKDKTIWKNPQNWIVFTVVPDVLQAMFRGILNGYVNEKFAFEVSKLFVEQNMDREVLVKMYHKTSIQMHLEVDEIFQRYVRAQKEGQSLHDRVKEHIEWILGERERCAEDIRKIEEEIRNLEAKAKEETTAVSGSLRGKINKLMEKKTELMKNKPRTSMDKHRGNVVGRAVFVAPFLLCRSPRQDSVLLHAEGCPAQRVQERVQLALVHGLCKGNYGNSSDIAKISNHPLSMLSAPICFMCGGGDLSELPRSLLQRAEYSLGRKETRKAHCQIKKEPEADD